MSSNTYPEADPNPDTAMEMVDRAAREGAPGMPEEEGAEVLQCIMAPYTDLSEGTKSLAEKYLRDMRRHYGKGSAPIGVEQAPEGGYDE